MVKVEKEIVPGEGGEEKSGLIVEGASENEIGEPRKNRILVLGSRISGAFELSEAFQKYLEQNGFPNPDVVVLRDAGIIVLTMLYENPQEVLEKFLQSGIPQEETGIRNLPIGVVLLPEMRQYSKSGAGMTLDSYSSGVSAHVEELCSEHGIPLVEIRGRVSNLDIEKLLRAQLGQNVLSAVTDERRETN